MRAFPAGLARIAGALLISLCVAPVSAGPAVLSADQERTLEAGSSFAECKDCPEMVVIPAGTFLMGSAPDDLIIFATPRHEVRIGSPFAISRTEVTVAQYAAFVAATGHAAQTGCIVVEDLYNGLMEPREALSWRDPGFPQTLAHPVTCVGPPDAEAYVEWLSGVTGQTYRLLSEAEWEYAARGGTTTPYHFGADTSDICLYGNGADKSLQYVADRPDFPSDIHDFTCSDQYVHTAPVGSFQANPFGLYDMHGNLDELLEDCSVMMTTGRGYDDAPTDGSAWMLGDCRTRVVRGGSWGSSAEELQVGSRSETGTEPQDRVGIRVARDLTQ